MHSDREDSTMSKWVKAIVVAIAVIAVIILAYALLTPQPDTDSDHQGMMNGMSSYSANNVALIALSTIMIVAAIMILLLREEYEPLPPSVETRPPVAQASSVAAAPTMQPERVLPAPAPPHDREEVAAREYLIMRLLTGDERTMFKAIVDAGGEALQKDLILRTKMSNAKVSRLLEKLEQKSVITKERHGATNRIKIKPE
jgi:uncharacterized membrane protein